MGLPQISLDEFLRQLRSQRGTTRKIRLAARYWQEIKSLSAADRERVALALGSQTAWKQLERLFRRDGSLSEDELAVQEALERLGRADPQELRRWAQALRKGGRRRVSDLVATAVQAALEEEADEISVPDDAGVSAGAAPAAAAAAASVAAPPAVGAAHRSPATAQSGPAPAPPSEVATAPAAENAAAVPPPAPPAVAPSPTSFEVASSPMSPAVTPPPAAPALAPLETERPDPPPASSQPAAVEPPPDPFAADDSRAGVRHHSGERSAAMSAVARLRELRELRENSVGVAAMGSEARAALVSRLGPGWASRRAVSEMIRSGALVGVDEALRLIAGLDSPARRWCLGVLIDHAVPSAAERERILEAAPSAAARRRLQRRMEAASRAT